MWVSKDKTVGSMVAETVSSPRRLEAMREAAAKLARPEAAESIAREILRKLEENSR